MLFRSVGFMRADSILFSSQRFASTLRSTRELSSSEVDHYHRHGFLFVRGLFTPNECDILLNAVKTDPLVSDNVMPMIDTGGRASKLTLWNHPGEDTYGNFARSRRMVNAVTNLTGREMYHFHTKLMMKEPKVGGMWEWHQDFGYWYQLGCLEPDAMMSSIIAIDKHTVENGCLQILDKSHKLGRLEHGITKEQVGIPKVVLQRAIERHELIYCEMSPGDVLFTHSNLLHTSAPNESDYWRRSMIVAYNGFDNSPRPGTICPEYEPLLAIDDAEIVNQGVKHLNPQRSDFLDHGRNVAQFQPENQET